MIQATGLTYIAYILAALLFILALAGLSKQETAKMGCYSGIAGMAIALIATFTKLTAAAIGLTIFAMVIGACVGLFVARKVQMTQMPELIACLHSFVGLAAVLVGFNTFFELGVIPDAANGASNAVLMDQAGELGIHLGEIFIGVFIGAVTFTGSIIAYGKLNGTYKLRIFKSAPLVLPANHWINLGALVLCVLLMVWFLHGGVDAPAVPLVIMTIIALAFGVNLVVAIGGADMPVVISMLNSYSGWAAAASGFMLDNDLLIVTGALVGSSGAILSYIMCKAMNRSFISVIAGGDRKSVV